MRPAVHRDRDVPILVALLGGGEEMLAAVLDPFHRPAKHHGRDRHHDFFRIKRRLGAEAAADAGRDDAHRAEVAVEQVGDGALADVGHLGRRPYGQKVGCAVVARQHGAGFERHGAAAVRKKILFEHVRGAGECRIDAAVAHRHERRHVGGEIGVATRCAGTQRIAAVVGGGQRLECDGDGGGGVLGDVAVRGDHKRDGLARIADLAAGERQLRAHGGDGRIGHRRHHRHGGEAARQVVRRQHRMDARHRPRRRVADPENAGMRMRTAQERAMKHAGELDVVHEAGTPGEQA
jgi:hypothetical protein